MSCKQSFPLRCGFCGGEIEGEDVERFWDREGGVLIDICLKCGEKIKAI